LNRYLRDAGGKKAARETVKSSVVAGDGRERGLKAASAYLSPH
jgi:hypothetical protein